MKVRFLLAFVSPSALLVATVAHAQDTSQVPAPPIASATPTQAVEPAIDAVNTSANNGDIVVTARRRAENLQDVPISITAVSGEALVQRGVVDALDLQYQTPSLTVTGSGPSRATLAYSIRGQRTNESQLLTDPPVGSYFAEVVMPRTFGFGTAFYDLQNIQVLKGVQGTLFGRNMTGGAVLIEPNHPDLSAIHAEATAQYGNLDLVDLYGMVNVPIVSDVLAFRVAGKFRDRKGFTTDVSTGRDFDDQHYYAVRASAELHLGRLNSFLVYDRVDEKENGTGNKLFSYALTDPLNGSPTVLAQQIGAARFFPVAAGAPQQNLLGQLNGALALGKYQIDSGNYGAGPLYVNSRRTPRTKVVNWGITNKTTFQAGDVTFKNIFGYRKIEFDTIGDYDGFGGALIQPNQFSRPQQVSEEFQMQGTPFGKNFDLTMGAYYFREWGQDGQVSANFPQVTAVGFASGTPALAAYFLNQPAKFYEESRVGYGVASSWATYAAGTLHLGSQFALSGGVRYNNDYRKAVFNPFYTTLSIPLGGGAALNAPCIWNGVGRLSRAACAQTRILKNDAITWDATAQFQPNNDVTVYVATRKGYRSGGFSLRATTDLLAQPFQPEFVQEYEVGLKNNFDLPLGRLNTNIAAYYQNYSNVQRQNPILVNGQVATLITNTAKQRNYGGEFEATLRMSGGFSANAFYAFVKNDVVSGGNGGFDQPAVPKHQAGGGLTYQGDISYGTVNANVNVAYRSSAYLDDFDVASLQKGYAIINARLGLDNIGGSGIGVAVWAKNLTDHYYKIGVLSLISNGPVINGVNPGGGPGFGAATLGEPRTYGLEASFKF